MLISWCKGANCQVYSHTYRKIRGKHTNRHTGKNPNIDKLRQTNILKLTKKYNYLVMCVDFELTGGASSGSLWTSLAMLAA